MALLLPLSGPLAEVGESMRRAAGLAQPGAALSVRDTGGDPAMAAREAQTAVAAGARLILGPLTAAETRTVAAVAGAVPVVSFSNDPALLGIGVHVFGVTPVQSVAAVLTHARDAGLESLAVAVPIDPYGEAVAAAVEELAPRAGLRLSGVLRTGADAAGAAAGFGAMTPRPDAVLIAHSGAALARVATALRGVSEARFLGTVQWLRDGPPVIPALEGAVFAAPEPDAFAAFAGAFEAETGTVPGLLAALAFDAAALARIVAVAPGALYRARGFDGVTGRYRLYDTGLCERELGVSVVGRTEAA